MSITPTVIPTASVLAFLCLPKTSAFCIRLLTIRETQRFSQATTPTTCQIMQPTMQFHLSCAAQKCSPTSAPHLLLRWILAEEAETQPRLAEFQTQV